MRQRELVGAVVRIWSAGNDAGADTVVGTGFLVSPRFVMTCAHVVIDALNLKDVQTLEAPRQEVLIDFPSTRPGHFYPASVTLWHPRIQQPEGIYDIAGLELTEDAPGRPARLVLLEDPWNRPCRVFGFPAGRPDGSYAEGALKDVLANGWVMIRGGDDAREFVRRGYSGGPVYTEDGVVGMLTEGDASGRVREAAMIPVSALLTAWPELYTLNATCPYQGLASFDETSARFFFGREEATNRLMAAIESATQPTILAGGSGSGKSSLVAAGLVPMLRQAGWEVCTFQPGNTPFSALAHALLRLWQPDLFGTALLLEQQRLAAGLRSGALSLSDVNASILESRSAETRLFIGVDQFEELFTLGGAEGDAAEAFLEQLVGALADPTVGNRVRLLLTVRTDFLDRILASPQLAVWHQEGGSVQYLGSLTELDRVIEAPLEKTGLGRFEEGLVERIKTDLAQEEAPLPLLEFTLTELWNRHQAGVLTHRTYDVLGGVGRALTNYAQGVYEHLNMTQREQAKRLFLQLMQPGSEATVTRRVARQSDLGDELKDLVSLLANKRLIMTARSPGQPDAVELIHEALFEHWPLLRSWIEEGWDFRRWQESMRTALREWAGQDETADYLLYGARLTPALEYLSTHAESLTADEIRFIQASADLQKQRQRETEERLRREAARQRQVNRVLAFSLVTVLLFTAVAAWQWTRARGEAAVTARLNTRLEHVNADLRSTSQRAQDNARTAQTHKLSAQGLLATQRPSMTNGDPRLGALLAAHAVRLEDNVQSRGNLLRVLQSEPALPSAEEPATALSADGRLLAVETSSEITLWDTSTQFKVATLPFDLRWHIDLFAHAFAFSPDSKILAVGGSDRNIWLWDVAASKLLGTPLAGHDYQVAALIFAPDGRFLISTGMDGTLITWDLQTRRAVGSVQRAALGGRTTTAENATGPLRFSSQTAVSPLLEQYDWLRSVAVSQDAKTLAAAGQDGSVYLFGFPQLMPRGKFLGNAAARSLAFSADGARLAIGDREGNVRLWETFTRTELATLSGLGTSVRALAFAPGGNSLVGGDASGTLLTWDLKTFEPLHEPLSFGAQSIHDLQFTNEALYVRGSEGARAGLWRVSFVGGTPTVRSSLRVTQDSRETITAWDAGGGSSLRIPLAGKLDSYLMKSQFSPDRERFVTLSGGKKAQLWRTATRQPLGPPFSEQGEIESVAFSPDGRTLATGSRDGRVVLRDAQTSSIQGAPLPLDIPRASGLAFQPDGQRLAIGTEGGVVIWDLQTKRTLEPEWDVPKLAREEIPSELIYTPDGKMLISDWAQHLYFWDSASLQMIGSPLIGPLDPYKVKRISVSPDSRWLAVTYETSQLVLWDLTTRKPVAEPFTFTWASAFDPESPLLALGGSDGSITLWNVKSREPVGDPIPAHTDEVRELSFGPDGKVLLSGGLDNTILSWDMGVRSWLTNACAKAGRNLTAAEWTRHLGAMPYIKTCPAYLTDITAVELLLSQADQATKQQRIQAARTLHARALRYAAEGGAPELVEEVCSTIMARGVEGAALSDCQGMTSIREENTRVVN